MVTALALSVFLALHALTSPPEPSRCYSSYNPVAVGAEWRYRTVFERTSSTGEKLPYRSESTSNVVALTADTVQIRTVAEGRPYVTDYTCGPDGAVAIPIVQNGSRIACQGPQTPPRPDVGTRWTSTLEMIDVKEGIGLRAITHYEVLGRERVTVPAGQFDAIKVGVQEESVHLDPDPKRRQVFLKSQQDIQTIAKSFRWYVPEVGLIRTSETITELRKGRLDHTKVHVVELVAFRSSSSTDAVRHDEAPAAATPQARLINIVRQLVALPRLEPAAVAAVVGRQLKPTRKYEDYRQDYDLVDVNDPALGTIDLRWNSRQQNGFLVADIKQEAALSLEQVRSTFGGFEFKGIQPGTDIHAPRELWSSLVVLASSRMDVRFNFPQKTFPHACNQVSLDELTPTR